METKKKHTYTYKEVFMKIIKDPVIICLGSIALILIISSFFVSENEERIINQNSVNEILGSFESDNFSNDNFTK